MGWLRLHPCARLLLPCSLALVLACGDDGTDDTAAGTTLVPTSGPSTGSASTGDESSAEVTGAPPECDAVACSESEVCVVPVCCDGSCTPDPPFCVAAELVICDFGSGLCTLQDVCSGALVDGALVCEPCDG